MYMSSLRFGLRMALRGLDEHESNNQDINNLEKEIKDLNNEIAELKDNMDNIDIKHESVLI